MGGTTPRAIVCWLQEHEAVLELEPKSEPVSLNGSDYKNVPV